MMLSSLFYRDIFVVPSLMFNI